MSEENKEIKIVFAEDSPVQGVMLKRILKEEGFCIEWGKNGKQALELIEKTHPSIIITDVEMPEMNGFELCKKVKSNEKLKNIPLIICSSLSNPEDILHGIELGADGYVTKPYDKKFLVQRIRTLLENPIRLENTENLETVELNYSGKKYNIVADSVHILNMLISTYENTLKQNNELFEAQLLVKKQKKELEHSYKESERLLLNILPKKIASELKEKGQTEPITIPSATVIFTDFKGFTKIAENLTPGDLVNQLDQCFSHFDSITEKYGIEKLKTIGDAYMCVGGVPEESSTHPIDCVIAALEIQSFMIMMKEIKENINLPYWELRLGVHTGPLVAGVIGKKKFAYDIWGDTVNTASRMESSGTVGKVNISGYTYELVKDFFEFEYRGKINAKNKGEIDMYYVNGLKKELTFNGDGKIPNDDFHDLYEEYRVNGPLVGKENNNE
ncbi:MAG: response regulator [Leptospiraceae bacterium]|nr:response regulator [Leptospiraceae bacterium]